MKIGTFKTDAAKEQDGTWIDAGGGLRLKIARLGNPRYKECMRELTKPVTRQLRIGAVDDDQAKAIMRKGISRFVLLGWENLEDDNGKPIVYTPAKAEELLGLDEFYKMVLELSQDVELFRISDVEDAQGNSQAVSVGTSNGDSKSSS